MAAFPGKCLRLPRPSFVALLVIASLRGAEPGTGPMNLSADRVEYLERNDETILTGRAELRETGLLLSADEFRFKGKTGDNPETITARGHVVYTHETMRVLADEIILHRQERSFDAQHIRLGSFPYYIQGESAHGTRDEVTVTKARISYGEPGPWQPTATADLVSVSANGHRIRTEGAQVGIGHIQPLPFPKLQQSVSDPLLSFVSLSGGYRGTLGAYVDAGVHLPVWPGVRLGGDLGFYTARGLMFGPSGSYSNPSDPDQLRGFFRSGYINDHGDKGVDLLGNPVPENRAFFEWEHRQQLTDRLSLTAQLNWWKDSEVVRDFRSRDFFPVQQPDTFAEATYANENSFVSAFIRAEPNAFEVVQQRAPEIRFDLLPLAVGGGFYERFNGSIAMLHERPVSAVAGTSTTTAAASAGGAVPANKALDSWTTISPYAFGAPTDLRTTRMDAYYSLSRPIAPNDWFALTPTAGGRVTHYMNGNGATANTTYTRVLGELGFDAALRSSGTFDYKNAAWHIDGIRHLFTPRISYRYIPDADKGQRNIPLIDRQTFSTYLPPLGLGDVRNLDQLRATNTLRLELDNTLQTRDPKYGSRDLLTFNVANDFLFKRPPGERDVSEVHAELAAMPTRWLEFGLYSRVAPQSFTLRELNSGITLKDGNAWSVRFANNFLRHQLEDYLIDGRARLNEEYDALAQLRYDQRKHRFTEQSYGIVQNLDNTWRVSYLVSFYSGRRRESGFSFSVQIDTVRF